MELSYVAQGKLLDVCRQSGLGTDSIVAADKPTLMNDFITFAAATDDVMIFSRGPAGTTRAAAERLDHAMANNGICRQSSKDITDELIATCVGLTLRMVCGV